MQEIDHAIKTVLTRNADSVLDLAFGSRRTIKLMGLADPQINIPELRADKVLIVKERGKIKYLICEAMLQPKRHKLLSFALKTLGNQYLLKKPSLRKHRDPRTIKVQRKLLAQIADPELREDLTAATILVAIRAFGAKVVRAEFTKKELHMVKKVSFVQDWLTESLQQGQRQGQQEGKLSVIEIILRQKLGALSPRLRSQLQKLDNRLTVKLQQITSQKDLQGWLKNGASRHASH